MSNGTTASAAKDPSRYWDNILPQIRKTTGTSEDARYKDKLEALTHNIEGAAAKPNVTSKNFLFMALREAVQDDDRATMELLDYSLTLGQDMLCALLRYNKKGEFLDLATVCEILRRKGIADPVQ